MKHRRHNNRLDFVNDPNSYTELGRKLLGLWGAVLVAKFTVNNTENIDSLNESVSGTGMLIGSGFYIASKCFDRRGIALVKILKHPEKVINWKLFITAYVSPIVLLECLERSNLYVPLEAKVLISSVIAYTYMRSAIQERSR